MKRGFYLIFAMGLLVQYVNCSSYSEGLTDNEVLSSSPVTDISAFEGVRILNGDTYMNCDEDHVQLGGSCNTGDAFSNTIEARILRDRVPLTWGIGASQVDHLSTTSCENGRFYVIIPRPNDSILQTGGTGYVEYQINLQMFSSKNGVSFTAGERAPVFNIQIQKSPCM